MKDLVTVKSRTVTDCSVPVVFQTIDFKMPDGTVDKRELCRSYVFKNFEATMPLKMAEKLIEAHPGEYFINKPPKENVSEEVTEKVNKLNRKSRGYINPINGFQAKSSVGLISHLNSKFPEEWEKSGKNLDSFMKMYGEDN